MIASQSSSPLLALPVELLPLIIESLDKSDLFNFRLTCRYMSGLGSQHLLRLIISEMQNPEPERRGLHLHKCVAEGSHDLMRLLLEYSPPLDNRTATGETALHAAARAGCVECVEMLVGAGAMLSPLSRRGWTPLMVAVREGHETVVRALLESGADPRVSGFFGWTALHLACRFGYRGIERLLHGAGAVETSYQAARRCSWTTVQAKSTLTSSS